MLSAQSENGLDTKNSNSKIVYQNKKGEVKDYNKDLDHKDSNTGINPMIYGLESAIGKCSTHRILPGETTNKDHMKDKTMEQEAMVRSISFKQIMISSNQPSNENSVEEMKNVMSAQVNKVIREKSTPNDTRACRLSTEIKNVSNGFMIQSMQLT